MPVPDSGTHHTTFVPAVEPFRDWMVVVAPSGKEIIEPAITTTAAERISVIGPRHKVITWHWATRLVGHIDPEEPTVISGIFFEGSNLRGASVGDWGDFATQPLTVDPKRGNYSQLHWKLDRETGALSFRASTDVFGLSQVYFGERGETSVISNRYHLSSIMLTALGQTTLDVSALTTAMFADSVVALQIATHSMPVGGVRLLPIGFEVRSVDGGRPTIHKRPTPAPDNESYDELIGRGCLEIADNVAAVLNYSPRPQKVLTLTGGLDSRLILAAVRHLGRLDEVVTHTARLGDEEDFSVGIRLSAHVGARFRDRPFGDVVPLRPGQHINAWRSFHLGTYHDLSFARQRVASVGPSIRLVGGCGELYRGYYQKLFPPEIVNANGQLGLSGITARLRSFRSWDLLKSVDREAVLDLIHSELKSIQGRTTSETLDNWYLSFRNRFHFGAASVSTTYLGSLAVSPLVSPSLHRAACLLPTSERVSGRALQDALTRLDAELAVLPFTSDTWPDGMPTKTEETDFSVSFPDALNGWEQARSETGSPAAESSIDRELWLSSLASLIAGARGRVANSLPEMDFVNSEAFSDRLAWVRRERHKTYAWWASRLAAAADSWDLVS